MMCWITVQSHAFAQTSETAPKPFSSSVDSVDVFHPCSVVARLLGGCQKDLKNTALKPKPETLNPKP